MGILPEADRPLLNKYHLLEITNNNMRRKMRLLLIGLIIATLHLPLLSAIPAEAQPFTSSGTRFGMNVCGNQYSDAAYTDVCMESWWGGGTAAGTVFNTNNYPVGPCSQATFWFCLDGDAPGLQTFNFYGEGIYNISVWGSFTTNQGWPYGGTSRGVVPGSLQTTVNSQGITITTCQIQFNLPQEPTAGYNLGASMPLTWITLSNINPNKVPNGDPNNFHLIRPGYPAWQSGNSFFPVTDASYPIFTTAYLDSFKPFCSLRFMPWMNTVNNSGFTWSNGGWVETGTYSWAQRPEFNGGQYFGCGGAANNIGGGAYEIMIALCNATGCDMWANVPTQATDDWRTGFANLVANDPVYHLNPWLHVYLEDTNEMWNWGGVFNATWQLVDNEARADFNPGGTGGVSWYNHGKEMGKRLMHDVVIMQPIFNQVSPDFCRPILAGQFVDASDYCGGGLSYIAQTFGPPKNYIYGIAGAPYFNSLDPTYITGTLQTAMNQNMLLANQYGIHMCAYESGQGLDSSPLATFNANEALQQTQAMVDQYNNFATMWKSSGGDLCELFANEGVDCQSGYWGSLPLTSQISNPPPKYVVQANMNNAFGCNCGNSQPPPQPAPATPSPITPIVAVPPPPPPSSATSSSSSSTSSSSSVQSNSRTTPGHWQQNSTFGRFWVWDIPKDAPMMPTH
jgi:hypothetical protein